MFDLSGKSALITGASGGIGAAIAEGLHAAGANVGLTGTRTDVLEKAAAALGDRAHALTADPSYPAAAEKLAEAAETALEGVDILINNAGITRDNLALRMKDAEWEEVLAVNLTAGFRLARAVLRPMIKRRFGRIISITSVVGVMGNPGQANYAAAKAGMVAMSKSLAQEVAARGITVNCIAPGFIATPMTDALTDAQKETLMARIPAGRFGTGADIAAACLYLSGDAGAYVTGQTLHVNGGMAMI